MNAEWGLLLRDLPEGSERRRGFSRGVPPCVSQREHPRGGRLSIRAGAGAWSVERGDPALHDRRDTGRVAPSLSGLSPARLSFSPSCARDRGIPNTTPTGPRNPDLLGNSLTAYCPRLLDAFSIATGGINKRLFSYRPFTHNTSCCCLAMTLFLLQWRRAKK